ncbi:MAG TPA: hypothetical protein P5150_07835, partial [Candidatus Ratteibacteria bacterium]|nr:hypothetical protein [Candidatus Ratteibacteria bacterium]
MIILFLGIIIVVIINIWLTSCQRSSLIDVENKLIRIETDLSKIDPLIRGGFTDNRNEIQKSFKDSREEITNLFKNLSETLIKIINEL